MTTRLPVSPAPGSLEPFAQHFDSLFPKRSQRQAFREYLAGLLLPAERNKTLTALAHTEPIVGAQAAPAQRLQWFLSESTWEADAVNACRLATLRTVTLAKRRGIDVEAVEVEGNHVTHVPRAMMRSIAFFQRISSQEITPPIATVTPLPNAIELDLGDGVSLNLVRVDPGSYQMGSPTSEAGRDDDESRHQVVITQPYAIGVFEVTQIQYRQVMGTSPSVFSDRGDFRARVLGLNTDDFPAENMTWEDAVDFCQIVSLSPSVRDKGWVMDLPSEAEWEYAARAGTETAFHYGERLSSDQANFNGNYPSNGAAKGPFLARPTKVGSYKPNAWGLFDIHGNISEWCKDVYARDYHSPDIRDDFGHVVRGGDWSTAAKDTRSASRRGDDRNDIDTGFRIVLRQRAK
jgi:formylglycine-generating enzyme required for sulfatase activity